MAKEIAMRRSVIGMGLLVGLTLLGLVGCTQRGLPAPEPQATPYTGPLRVEPPETGPDHSGGAAGRAVRCRSEPAGYNDVADKHEGEVFATPRAALDHGLADAGLKAAPEDFQKVAETSDRMMYTHQSEGVIVFALVAHLGVSIDGTAGWYAESAAWCNAAEFSDSITRASGIQIWTDSSGRRALTTEIVSNEGPEHCNWQHLTFLRLDDSREALTLAYVAGARPDLDEYFDEPYRQHLALPDDAVDTGYNLGDDHLWLSPDGRRAYVGSRSQVDLWPRTNKPMYCL
jgi:hypothetical protein